MEVSRPKRPVKTIIEDVADIDDDLLDVQSQNSSEDERVKTKKSKVRKSQVSAASKSTENAHPNILHGSKSSSSSSSSSAMKRKASTASEKDQDDDNDDDDDDDDQEAERSKKPKAAVLLDSLLEGLGTQTEDDILADVAPEPEDVSNNNNKSEAGQIVQIKIENFMCHQKLTVDFCKNVNFITGQNGSGTYICAFLYIYIYIY